MKKTLLLGTLVVGTITTGVVFAQGNDFITIGSGATTGVYFPVATGMARLINEANVGLRANARSTGGSVVNVNSLASGELQVALAQNDITYYAYRGTGIAAFEGKANNKLRVMASLYPEIIHVVARRDARITSIANLRGKRVVIGDLGSGTEQTARQVLEAYGLKFEDLGQAIRVGTTQGVALMQDGRADALFFTAGLGSSGIQQLAQTVDTNFVPITGTAASRLLRDYPFYVRFTIPKNTYRNQALATASVAVQATLVTTTDQSETAVYNMMKAVFGNEANLKGLHPNLNTYFSRQRAVRGLPAPLHAGAVRFWREQGLNVR